MTSPPSYTPDQQRVADWIFARTGGDVGGGDDPIGFLLASYAMQHQELQDLRVLWDECQNWLDINGIVSEKDAWHTPEDPRALLQTIFSILQKKVVD